jgi:hypothetical protein
MSSIHHFGTTDLYSTEPVNYILLPIHILTYLFQGELEHHLPKGRYHHTDKRTFVCQLTQIEHHEAHLHHIKQQ